MPHSRAASVLLAAILLIAAPALAQGSEKPPAPPRLTMSASAPGGENVGTSTLANVTPTLLTVGSPFDLCFTVFVQSPDAEYGDHFDVDLPDGWTVNSVAANSVPPADGCSSALPPASGTAAGNVVYWQSNGYPPQTGCGAWNGGSTGENFDFCANVTIPDTTGAPWTLPWNYVGDGWGVAPHSVSGNWGPVQPLAPGIFLTPEETLAEGCPCETQQHELSLWNNTGASTTFNLTYALTQGSGTCTGPAQVAANDGATVPFTVDLYPQGDFGDVVICNVGAVDATTPTYTDTALITKTLIEGGFDPAGWQAEPVTGATPNQWAGAAVGTHPSATGPVGYVVGGLGAGTSVPNADLQLFDPATGTWTQLADMPNQRFSPVVGWIDGKLYAAGGYDPAFAATNDLQVFDPVAGTWDNTTPANLPNARGGGAGGVGNCSSGAGECLFHVGGGPDSSFANTTQETWQYDPVANAWTQLDNKPAGSSPDGQILGAGVGCLGLIYVGGDYRG
ncbi:MAG TPA: kelch repeat-containing protein, partial [Thermoanaerobaculia bacterium]|nr:kelch repeat-containing protein [Thermoanaerobaculia bacterium]